MHFIPLTQPRLPRLIGFLWNIFSIIVNAHSLFVVIQNVPIPCVFVGDILYIFTVSHIEWTRWALYETKIIRQFGWLLTVWAHNLHIL